MHTFVPGRPSAQWYDFRPRTSQNMKSLQFQSIAWCPTGPTCVRFEKTGGVLSLTSSLEVFGRHFRKPLSPYVDSRAGDSRTISAYTANLASDLIARDEPTARITSLDVVIASASYRICTQDSSQRGLRSILRRRVRSPCMPFRERIRMSSMCCT